MTNQEAERILNPATSREALLPYALDCQHRIALLEEACRVACAALRGPQWISVKERLPENEDFVFVEVTGKYRNIRFDNLQLIPPLGNLSHSAKEEILKTRKPIG